MFTPLNGLPLNLTAMFVFSILLSVQRMKLYPYQDTTTDLLLGEVWKSVPGLRGYYKASNLGRLRSVDRKIPHQRLGRQFVKGRILRQSIARNRNIKTGEPMIDLRVSLAAYGEMYYFNTRRVIFMTFSRRTIDFERDGLYVINIDADGFNCRFDNLKLCSKSEKQKRVFARGRQDSHLKTADRSQWKNHGGAARRKPVKQYKKGRLIARYESIAEASRKTGFGDKEIIRVAKGYAKQWAGYVWRYDKH